MQKKSVNILVDKYHRQMMIVLRNVRQRQVQNLQCIH